MHSEGASEIDAAIRALMESLHKCWGHFHLLQGLHEGCNAHPEAISYHKEVLLQIWRAAFEALFVATGTLLDHRKGVVSIHTTFKLVRKLGTPEVKSVLPALEARLDASDGAIQKMRQWRHNAVAHWTEAGRDGAFYEKNRLSLSQVEAVLQEIEAVINEVSRHATCVHNIVRGASKSVVYQSAFMMEALAVAATVERPRSA